MHCKCCGSKLRRLPRKGFLQMKVFPLVGHYPWECPICRVPVMMKKQHQRKSQTLQEDSGD